MSQKIRLRIEMIESEKESNWTLKISENPDETNMGFADIVITSSEPKGFLQKFLTFFAPEYPSDQRLILLQKVDGLLQKHSFAWQERHLRLTSCTQHIGDGNIPKREYLQILELFKNSKHVEFRDYRVPRSLYDFLHLSPEVRRNILHITQHPNTNNGTLGAVYKKQTLKPYEVFQTWTTSEKIDFFIQEINKFLEIYNNIKPNIGKDYLKIKSEAYSIAIQYLKSYQPWLGSEDNLSQDVKGILLQKDKKNTNTRVGIENLRKYLTAIQEISQDPPTQLDDPLPTTLLN